MSKTPHTVESGKMDLDVPSVASDEAPQESSMAGEASRYVALPEWQPIKTAPRDETPIQAKIPGHGSDNVIAWFNGLIDSSGNDCGGWQWMGENEPPESWTDGVCWAVNEDGVPSVEPTEWKAISVSDEQPKAEDAVASEPVGCQRGGEAETPHLSPDTLTQGEIGDLDRNWVLRNPGEAAKELARVTAENLTLSRQVEDLTRERGRLEAIVISDDPKAIANYEWERANAAIARAEAAEQKVKDLTRERDEKERERARLEELCNNLECEVLDYAISENELKEQNGIIFDLEQVRDEYGQRAVDAEAALTASQAQAEALRGAASALVAARFDTYKARNGRQCSIESDDGEKCWIVPFEEMHDLEAALSLPNTARDIKTGGVE